MSGTEMTDSMLGKVSGVGVGVIAVRGTGVSVGVGVGVGGKRCSIGVYPRLLTEKWLLRSSSLALACEVSKRGAMFFYSVP